MYDCPCGSPGVLYSKPTGIDINDLNETNDSTRMVNEKERPLTILNPVNSTIDAKITTETVERNIYGEIKI